jgi:crotonobetainyl-CoA:carnitine CoA-transferase CaiB-like acyl-CoA transferase
MLSPEEIVAHPQMAARSAFPAVVHPTRGTVRVTATPFHLDGLPIEPAGPAPHRVGEHTREVLTDMLGYSAQQIEALIKARVVEEPNGD